MNILRTMAYFMIFMMATGTVTAIDPLPSLSSLFLGRDYQIEDGGKSHLPTSLYSVSGAITTPDTEYVLTIGSGEADTDFINTINHNAIEYRARRIPANHKVTEVAGYACSVNPDWSNSVITSETQTSLCFDNQDYPGVVFRLWDIENDMEYVGEKPVTKQMQSCFIVEPDHQYLYDIMTCAGESCHCTKFTNNYCEDNEGSLQMLRTRDCSPDNCDIEKVWVDWVDTTVPGCDKIKSYCRETDAGIDYIHYGKTTKGSTTMSDVCINENRLKEYYCIEDEIQYKYHNCLPNQECVKGECITLEGAGEDCDIVDGKLRLSGQEWCLGVTKKTCKNGTIELNYMHDDCTTASCDYNGIIFNIGESVCMNNGVTIATCKDPINQERMFTYRQCPEDTECKPNTQKTDCREVSIQDVEQSTTPTRLTIWEWFKNLFGGSK